MNEGELMLYIVLGALIFSIVGDLIEGRPVWRKRPCPCENCLANKRQESESVVS